MEFWQQLLLCLFGSGSIGFGIAKLFMRSEARAELKEDIEKLHERINLVEQNYVTCKFCTMQHDNLTKTLQSMDNKLDTLISKF